MSKVTKLRQGPVRARKPLRRAKKPLLSARPEPLTVQVVVQNGIVTVTNCPAGVRVVVEDRDIALGERERLIVWDGTHPRSAE